MELEEFRNELLIYDAGLSLIPYLTKEETIKKVPAELSSMLIKNNIFIAYMVLPKGKEILPGDYKIILLKYTDYDDSYSDIKLKRQLPMPYRMPRFIYHIRFFDNETTSVSLVFEEAITHRNFYLELNPYAPRSEVLSEANSMEAKLGNIPDKPDNQSDVEFDFHLKEEEHHISFGISGKIRENRGISKVYMLYQVAPDKERRNTIRFLIFFSWFLPIIIFIMYFKIRSLPLLEVLVTTDMVALFSISLAQFKTGLISMGRSIAIAGTLLVAVLLIILFLFY